MFHRSMKKDKEKSNHQSRMIVFQEASHEVYSLNNSNIRTESRIMLQDNKLEDYTNNQQRYIKILTKTFESSLIQLDEEKSVMKDFENKFNNKKFGSVWKLSTQLMDKNLRILWEGRLKGFLLSARTELLLSKQDKGIRTIIIPET